MPATIFSAAFRGREPQLVTVECSTAPGLPGFAIVGLPDKAVSEAKDRIRASLSELHISLPSKKITINLSPADLPKMGAQFDLPIALAVLEAIGVLEAGTGAEFLAVGELSLGGELIATRGALPAALLALETEKTLLCASGAGQEAAWIEALRVYEAPRLMDLLHHLTEKKPLAQAAPAPLPAPRGAPCFSEIKGQERAKRAMEIAAAGHHHMLLVGPPGAGKTMLATRLPGILPPFGAEERLESSILHSLAGSLGEQGILAERPFLAPHHSASMAAMVGGGKQAGPGQISLAHNGVLFLDELPEFKRDVLEALREPLEAERITIARADQAHTYPSRFQLIAAANPCRCGDEKSCKRGAACSRDYLGKISGPLLDRIDIRLEVPPVSFQDLQFAPSGEASETIAARVSAARALQEDRYATHPGIAANGQAGSVVLDEVARPSAAGRALLEKADARFGLSARSYYRLLRLARTIADLDGDAEVDHPHLSEAIAYRLSGSGAMPWR